MKNADILQNIFNAHFDNGDISFVAFRRAGAAFWSVCLPYYYVGDTDVVLSAAYRGIEAAKDLL